MSRRRSGPRTRRLALRALIENALTAAPADNARTTDYLNDWTDRAYGDRREGDPQPDPMRQ